jgi:uncharacterized protein YceH (UPF0502 family)
MIQLDPTECRVLGVLVEKAHTSSGYPLSLNAATDGCNQKSNRHPVVTFDEDRVMLALDRLRAKGLVVFADSLGSRVTKFRHNARETLGVDDAELVLLAELLLRGPQTAAELRMRASRMQPLESPEVVQAALGRLMDRPEPMVQRVPTPRADRYAQLLCPGLHPLDAAPPGEAPGAEGGEVPGGPAAPDRLAAVEAQVLELRQIVERLAAALGATDILKPPGGSPT